MEECPPLAKPHGPTHLPRVMFWHVYDLQEAPREASETEGGVRVPGRWWTSNKGKHPTCPQDTGTSRLRSVTGITGCAEHRRVCGCSGSFSTENGLSQSPHRPHTPIQCYLPNQTLTKQTSTFTETNLPNLSYFRNNVTNCFLKFFSF